MKKKAILYTWAAAGEELAHPGLSTQEKLLTGYCEANSIDVVNLYSDAHPSSAFNRPVFRKMLSFCRNNRKGVDLLLFANWACLSRTTKDILTMAEVFGGLGINLCSVNQPLDLSVPENQLMLIFYLSSSKAPVAGGMKAAQGHGIESC